MLPKDILKTAIFLATSLATGRAFLLPLLFPVSIKISITSNRKHPPPPKPDYHFSTVPVYKEVVVKDGTHGYKHSYGDGHKYGTSYGDGHVKVYTDEPHIKGHKYSKGYGTGSSIHFPGPTSTHFQGSAYAHAPHAPSKGAFLSFEASIHSKPHPPTEYEPQPHYIPEGHHKGTEYIQPGGHHKGTGYVIQEGHHKGTEYIQPGGHHTGTGYVIEEEHHKGTEYIQPNGHHKGTEYVIQEGHHKGTEYIQPNGHHKGTDYAIQEGHHKGTEYIQPNGHHKGTDYVLQEGHHKGTDYIQPNGHHKGTDYALQEGHHKGTDYIQPNGHHKGTDYVLSGGHHAGTDYIQPSKGGFKPYTPNHSYIKSVKGYKMSDYLPVTGTGYDEKPNKYITSHVAIPPNVEPGHTYADISAAHQASHAPKAYDAKEYADLGVHHGKPVQEDYADESGYLDDSLPAYKYPPTRHYSKRNGESAPEPTLYAGFGTSVYGDSYAKVVYRPKNLRIRIKAFRH